MRIRSIKTQKITVADNDLYAILDRHLTVFPERAVLAITSKIVSLCQNRVVAVDEADKDALVAQEADYYFPVTSSNYAVNLTIKANVLIPSAGIDESNTDGYYVLWPRDLQETANRVCAYLRTRFSRREVGVIITDSKTTPLRWGVTGVGLVHSGFAPLNDHVGKPDIFGRTLQMTTVNVADALAVAAVLVMGEADEQTPLAVIDNLPFVTFQDRNPSPEELAQRWIDLEDDLYAPLLKGIQWRKGHGGIGSSVD